MASSLPDVSLTRTKELGRYSGGSDAGSGRPQETNRLLADKEIDIIKKCAGCGKHMTKVKNNLVCSCMVAFYCSKDCQKSSNHKCNDPSLEETAFLHYGYGEKTVSSQQNGPIEDLIVACYKRYQSDKKANQAPSSGKIQNLMKMTGGNPKRLLAQAEAGRPMASYVVGYAYAERTFDRRQGFAIPNEYKDKSAAETNEIAVKWLAQAAEGGVPEAMFHLYFTLMQEGGIEVDYRVVHYWVAEAHATGQMNYLSEILETRLTRFDLPAGFQGISDTINEDSVTALLGSNLAHFLLATRCQELKNWGGKTAMGKPFYAWAYFNSIMAKIGDIGDDESMSPAIVGEQKIVFPVVTRSGYSEAYSKSISTVLNREENNIKFKQGHRDKLSLDFKLVEGTFKVSDSKSVDGRTPYLTACIHKKHIFDNKEEAVQIDYKEENDNEGKGVIVSVTAEKSLEEILRENTIRGECAFCVQDAKQRLRAVSLGLFSISLTQVIPSVGYAARYAREDGVIVQDVFNGTSKPDMRQALQCLMTNPADLHPLSIAEEANLFWPIIWFWGSVFKAVKDSCNQATVDAIYHSLEDKICSASSENASAREAFPESAAGEWRIACGSENCPRVDHEVKFNLCKGCKGCKVRRYCDATCQKEDWPKHMKFCKAAK